MWGNGANLSTMSYWGKLLGGIAGFATGGPVGAMIGAALGHAADSGAIPKISMGDSPLNPARLAALLGGKQQLFAVGVVVLSAKVAKADGPVVRAFARIGWEWGGHWQYSKDYMHFSRNGL